MACVQSELILFDLASPRPEEGQSGLVRVGEEMAINICGLDACFLMSLTIRGSIVGAKRPLKTEGERRHIFME